MATRSRTHPSRRPAAATGDATAPTRPSQLPLVLSAIALAVAGIGLWLAVAPSASSTCQSRAWDSLPADEDLPQGWTVATSNYFVGNLTVTIAGPLADGAEQPGEIFATVTCYEGDASEALARSRSADHVVGNQTNETTNLGDGGYEILDESAALAAVHFRRGDLAAYIQGDASAEDLRAVAAVFDRAMQDARPGGIPSIVPLRTFDLGSFDPSFDPGEESIDPSSPLPSVEPSELAAILPTEVSGTAFTVEGLDQSQLGGSPGGRALVAGVRALGREPADLLVAQAYDELGEIDLYFLAFQLPDADPTAFKALILDSWLVAGAEGVTVTEVELGGKDVTSIDYVEDAPPGYLYTSGTIAVVVQAGDATVATAAIEALP
jgi:hypothetical protein